MSNKLKLKRDGFTIIEVIIVLVIGAIIMLAVFLVVPQLQQAQRNSRRQSDARRILSAVEQYKASNSGNANQGWFIGSVGVDISTDIGNYTSGRIGDPSQASGSYYTVKTDGTATTNTITPDQYVVITKKDSACNGANQWKDQPGSAAVIIALEPWNGTKGVAYCVND